MAHPAGVLPCRSLGTGGILAWLLLASVLLPVPLAAHPMPVNWLADERPVWDQRPGTPTGTELERLHALIEAQLAGPDPAQLAAGMENLLPAGTRLVRIDQSDQQFVIVFELPDPFLEHEIDDVWLDHMARWIGRMADESASGRALLVKARSKRFPRERYLSRFLSPAPPLKKPEPAGAAQRAEPVIPVEGPAATGGALSGASVFLSPGHGWTYSPSLGRWSTQRGNTHGLVEDLSNGEAVLQYLRQYLSNAGARVYTVRERDLQERMVIVDHDSAGYSETGAWQQVSASGALQGDQREAPSSKGPATATASFAPDLPEAGHYAVYAWYRPAVSGATAPGTPIRIRHSGGETLWIQNQNHDGFTWKYLGTYHFPAGFEPDLASVEIGNSTGESGQWVVADAVRFGGGMGDLPDDTSGSISGYPRWEESGRYFAGFMGKADWADANTVSAMPRYASWEHESWEQGTAVYVSWHTNAPSPARGTSSFAYSSAGWDGPFDSVEGGDLLRNAIHDQLINDLRGAWDPDWTDRGTSTNWFGEINPSHNPDMPASLHEIAFHATEADAAALAEPRFRQLAARAVYQGIVDFYAAHMSGFDNPVHLPEPPTRLAVRAIGPDRVRISWQPGAFDPGDDVAGDPATGYRIYRSGNGKGFDGGTDVGNVGSAIIDATPGQPLFVRVTAVNAGGESFPTRTLSVRTTASGLPATLIVDGFDRIDARANLPQELPHLGTVDRGLLARMNTYDYAVTHAEAIDAIGRGFDSVENEVIADQTVSLESYHTVIWILGEESTADRTFDEAEQALAQSFLDGGGRLFVSGAEIGWDLVANGNGPAFFSDGLRADYLADDGGSHTAQGVAGTIFEAIAEFAFDDGSNIYDVGFPDRLGPANGSVVAMTYTDPGSGGAAVQYADPGGQQRIVCLGFPFETIIEAEVREAVMAAALGFLETPESLSPDIFADRFEP